MGKRQPADMIVLITGMSGTGKSAVTEALVARGHRAVDLDDPAWSEYRATEAGDEWMWRDAEVERLLAETSAEETLFISGCASNQVNFYDRIGEMILLTAPLPVMLARLAARTTNDYGKSPEDIAAVIENHREIEPLLRRRATLVLDATASIDELVDAILGNVESAPA